MDITNPTPILPPGDSNRNIMSVRCRVAGLCLFLLASFGIEPAQATLILYTGQDFTSTSAGGTRVTATFDFSTPLTDGAVLTLADVSSWSMSAREFTMTDSSASFSVAEFTIGPDLLPASWLFAAEEEFVFIPNNLPESILSYKGPESIRPSTTEAADFLAIDDISSSSVIVNPAFGASLNSSPDGSSAGTWSVVPEPASLWLMGLGVLLIAARRR